MSLTRWTYEHSPVFWQNLMCTVAGYRRRRQRFNRGSEQRRAFYREAAKWPREQAEAYQLTKLCEMVAHAYATVPFYRARLAKGGIRPEDLNSFAAFAE